MDAGRLLLRLPARGGGMRDRRAIRISTVPYWRPLQRRRSDATAVGAVVSRPNQHEFTKRSSHARSQQKQRDSHVLFVTADVGPTEVFTTDRPIQPRALTGVRHKQSVKGTISRY